MLFTVTIQMVKSLRVRPFKACLECCVHVMDVQNAQHMHTIRECLMMMNTSAGCRCGESLFTQNLCDLGLRRM